MPIATVHELIKTRVRVKVTSNGYCYCTGASSKTQSVFVTIGIHKLHITWCKVERTNVFGELRSGTLTHEAHHKYAFVPLLVETGPGNILNVTLYIFHLPFIGTAWSVHTTGSEKSAVYEGYASLMQHSPPECEATKG